VELPFLCEKGAKMAFDIRSILDWLDVELCSPGGRSRAEWVDSIFSPVDFDLALKAISLHSERAVDAGTMY